MATTYRVVLNGVSSGQEVNQVATQLAKLSNIPVQTALTLLATPGTVVKRGLDLESAARIVAGFQMVGCNCVLEPEVTEQETLAIDPAALQSIANRGAANVGRSPASNAVEAASRVAAEPHLSTNRETARAPGQRASGKPTPPVAGHTSPSTRGVVMPESNIPSKMFLGIAVHNWIIFAGLVVGLPIVGLWVTSLQSTRNEGTAEEKQKWAARQKEMSKNIINQGTAEEKQKWAASAKKMIENRILDFAQHNFIERGKIDANVWGRHVLWQGRSDIGANAYIVKFEFRDRTLYNFTGKVIDKCWIMTYAVMGDVIHRPFDWLQDCQKVASRTQATSGDELAKVLLPPDWRAANSKLK